MPETNLSEKTVLFIIPARGGSVGIPDKNLQEFDEESLTTRAIRKAVSVCSMCLTPEGISDSRKRRIVFPKNSKSKVIVSSDDIEILYKTKPIGVGSVQLVKDIRPDYLSTSESPTEDTIEYLMDRFEGDKYDAIVLIQVTTPLVTWADLRNGLYKFFYEDYDSLFSSCPAEDLFVWSEEDGELKSTTYDYKQRKRRQDIEHLYLENGAFYVFRPEIFRKYHNRLGGKIGTFVCDKWKKYEIDEPLDLEICKAVKEYKNGN